MVWEVCDTHGSVRYFPSGELRAASSHWPLAIHPGCVPEASACNKRYMRRCISVHAATFNQREAKGDRSRTQEQHAFNIAGLTAAWPA